MTPSRFIAAALAGLILVTAPVLATEIQDINQQFRKGDLSGALTRANAYLAKNPKDAQARFLKGLILADQGKSNEAIQIFKSLTEDYPELPEPYNNLAVLYAAQNKYEDAKNALEMAIRTHPSYATAHENLGDIYAKMASIAYDKALQLDNTNPTAQTKLALIKEIVSGQPRRPATSVKPTSPSVAAATPATPPDVRTPPATRPASPATPTPAAPAAAAIESTVNAWAEAWSNRDVASYLAFYADDFDTGGMSRVSWEAQRRERLSKPSRIEVKLSDIKIAQNGADKASVTFKQAYASNLFKSQDVKTLALALKGDKWQIVREAAR
jgi:tetratricopeptide (TPR) repeat protein